MDLTSANDNKMVKTSIRTAWNGANLVARLSLIISTTSLVFQALPENILWYIKLPYALIIHWDTLMVGLSNLFNHLPWNAELSGTEMKLFVI